MESAYEFHKRISNMIHNMEHGAMIGGSVGKTSRLPIQLPKRLNRRRAFEAITKWFPSMHLDVDELMFRFDEQRFNDKLDELKIDAVDYSPIMQEKIHNAIPSYVPTYKELGEDLCSEFPVYACVEDIVKNTPTSKYIKMDMMTDFDFTDPKITDWYLDFEGCPDVYDEPIEVKNIKDIIYDIYDDNDNIIDVSSTNMPSTNVSSTCVPSTNASTINMSSTNMSTINMSSTNVPSNSRIGLVHVTSQPL